MWWMQVREHDGRYQVVVWHETRRGLLRHSEKLPDEELEVIVKQLEMLLLIKERDGSEEQITVNLYNEFGHGTDEKATTIGRLEDELKDRIATLLTVKELTLNSGQKNDS